ncbi:MAG TPA: 50S ribosomal protein L6 [Bacteroidales bacterium]|nr:50S ribosomal protein L6 [Bacteroidales bacterium]
MSRIGILPIELPSGVTINISETNEVKVKGPKGELSQQVDHEIKIEVKENQVTLSRPNDEKRLKSLHGLYRSLLNNMVVGVSQGFTTEQEIVGVGYRAEAKGQVLEMSLGFSHDVQFMIPEEVKVEVKQERRGNPIVIFTSINKQLLGQVAAKLRSLRPPEPYKGKGIKFVGEQLRKKAGKAAKV